jgi:23S rRNA pseudouridine1911/1915/1917 synthase
MMEEGHSIIGDKKYGATGNPIKRLGLHALSIEFFHPITNKLMKFDTRIPAKFSQLVR